MNSGIESCGHPARDRSAPARVNVGALLGAGLAAQALRLHVVLVGLVGAAGAGERLPQALVGLALSRREAQHLAEVVGRGLGVAALEQ